MDTIIETLTESVIETQYRFFVNVNHMTLNDYRGAWSDTEIAHARDIVNRLAVHIQKLPSFTSLTLVSVDPSPLVSVESKTASLPLVISAKDDVNSARVSLMVREALEATREAFPHDAIDIEKATMKRKVMKVEETTKITSFGDSCNLR